MRKLAIALTVSTLCLPLAFAASPKESDRILNARDVIKEVMATPDKGIPKSILDGATCVAVVPGLKKAGFIVGAEGGRGIVSCRKSNGAWGPPSMISIGGGSFGLQIGGSSTDVIMVVRNRKGVDLFLKDKFEVGADANVAAGPMGRDAQAP